MNNPARSKRPREFWLHREAGGTADPDYQALQPDDAIIKEFHHVIEYSAYEKCQAEIRALRVEAQINAAAATNASRELKMALAQNESPAAAIAKEREELKAYHFKKQEELQSALAAEKQRSLKLAEALRAIGDLKTLSVSAGERKHLATVFAAIADDYEKGEKL